MSISIVVPFYNEKECIEECIKSINESFENEDYEIICVNDGSSDGSENIVAELAESDDRIKYISYNPNKGYSHAIRSGFKESTKEYVSFVDADLQYHPKDLLKLYNHAKENDLHFVLGVPQNKYSNLRRRLMSYCYNLYVSLIFNMNFKDANSLKLMRRKFLENINFQFEYGMIEIELLVGFKMQNIPINTFATKTYERSAGVSKCSFKIIWHTIIDCIRLRMSRNSLVEKGYCIPPAQNQDTVCARK
ncbi:MAG: glycosyltransferase family 2 protein [Kiritimatiellales bacterium]|nr:glycosyltransferase family 2 protein [Kiritimatiellales bacterium]